VVFLVDATSNGNKSYVIKQFVHNEMNIALTKKENQAVVEYNILSFLYPHFHSVPECSVPKPILVVPEIEAYLMEFVEGSLLMDSFRYTRFFSPADGYRKLLHDMERCGKWLRYFHEFTGIQSAGSDSLENIIERAEHRLELIEESGDKRIPTTFRKAVSAFIDGQVRKIVSNDIYVTGRHGDFTPFNIITGHNEITVIDFLGYKKDPPCVDLLKILIFLEDEFKSISSSGVRVKALKSSFLKGYGELPTLSGPILLICEAMQRIVSIWGQLSSDKIHLHHKFESRLRISSHIRWLMSMDTQGCLWHTAR
jgi:tRNA A-37 threonylcarbamoyl transferase component Bud32